MTTPRAALFWWFERLEVPPHPNHLQRLIDTCEAHGLGLDRCRLVCNQDRAWGDREPGRHYLGRTGSSGRLWLVED